jgi:hypothetical protein
VFYFSKTAFSFHFFALIFVQILLCFCIKVYLYHWSMLVFIKRVISKRFELCWKREKISCQKWYKKGACLDCGLELWCRFYSMLSSFLCSMTCLKWLRLLNEPLKKSCVVFIMWKHFIMVFSLMLYLGWLGACLQHVWL